MQSIECVCVYRHTFVLTINAVLPPSLSLREAIRVDRQPMSPLPGTAAEIRSDSVASTRELRRRIVPVFGVSVYLGVYREIKRGHCY